MLNSPWIAVKESAGERQTVGLLSLFGQLDQIAELDIADPIERLAVIRLLVAISTAARRDDPSGDHGASCLAYLEQNAKPFQFDDECWLLGGPVDDKAVESPLARLDMRRASGNNATLFDHSVDSDRTPVERASLILEVLRFQFAAVGGGTSIPTNFVHAQMIYGTHAWIEFATLKQTLEAANFEVTDTDLPRWQQTGEGQVSGPLSLLTATPRRVALVTNPDGLVTSCQVRQGQGLTVEDAVRDSMLLVVNEKPHRSRENAGPLELVIPELMASGHYVAEQAGSVEPEVRVTLRMVSVQSEQAKVSDIHGAALHVTAGQLTETANLDLQSLHSELGALARRLVEALMGSRRAENKRLVRERSAELVDRVWLQARPRLVEALVSGNVQVLQSELGKILLVEYRLLADPAAITGRDEAELHNRVRGWIAKWVQADRADLDQLLQAEVDRLRSEGLQVMEFALERLRLTLLESPESEPIGRQTAQLLTQVAAGAHDRPPTDWWATTLGGFVASFEDHGDQTPVPTSDASQMLGISPPAIYDLRNRQKLDRADGGVTRGSVMRRLAIQYRAQRIKFD